MAVFPAHNLCTCELTCALVLASRRVDATNHTAPLPRPESRHATRKHTKIQAQRYFAPMTMPQKRYFLLELTTRRHEECPICYCSQKLGYSIPANTISRGAKVPAYKHIYTFVRMEIMSNARRHDSCVTFACHSTLSRRLQCAPRYTLHSCTKANTTIAEAPLQRRLKQPRALSR